MNVLDRLKLKIKKKEYYTDEEYVVFLQQNDFITPNETIYNHKTMQRQLLQTVVDVLETLANDVDLMRKTEGKFATVGEAYKFIEKRIIHLNELINKMPDPDVTVDNSSFSFFIRRSDY